MNDKELLYQIINREVSNVLIQINPTLALFSNTATNYIINFIDPYVTAFLAGGEKINTQAAGAFVKEEVNEKVDAFIKKFESESKKDAL